MKKKLFTIALTAIMVVAMAVPTLAAPPPKNVRTWIYNKANIYPNLNAATSGTPKDLTNVTLWSNTGDTSQRWSLEVVDSTQKLYYIRNFKNTTVGLNIYRDGTNNCNLYTVSGNNPNDCKVKCVEEADGYYGIVLPYYTLCLTPTGFDNGANVAWQTPSGQNNQLWRIVAN